MRATASTHRLQQHEELMQLQRLPEQAEQPQEDDCCGEAGCLSPPPPFLPVCAECDAAEELPCPVATSCVVYGEYHCIFSSSYRVPVLLLRLSFADGQPLSLPQTIWALEQYGDSRSAALTSRLAAVGDGDSVTDGAVQSALSSDFPPLSLVLHPALSSPFLCLHPCRTAAVMAVLQADSAVSKRLGVLAWLAAVSPVVGLQLPFTAALREELRGRAAQLSQTASGA